MTALQQVDAFLAEQSLDLGFVDVVGGAVGGACSELDIIDQ